MGGSWVWLPSLFLKFHVSKTQLTPLHLPHSSKRIHHLGWPLPAPFPRSRADLFCCLWSLPSFRPHSICHYRVSPSVGSPASHLPPLMVTWTFQQQCHNPSPPVQTCSVPRRSQESPNSSSWYLKPSNSIYPAERASLTAIIRLHVPWAPSCFPSSMALLTDVFQQECLTPPHLQRFSLNAVSPQMYLNPDEVLS